MSNLAKKIRDDQDKKVLEQYFGRKPKHRCPICHRYTLYVQKKPKDGIKVRPGETECVMCEMIKKTREMKNEEGRSTEPSNIGE